MLNLQTVRAEFPEHLAFLFEPHRYKVLYGGRGGGKSWAIADALLLLAAKKKLRILCTRELQKSIKDSSYKLLCDRIEVLGLRNAYEITLTSIRCIVTESEFIFEGLRSNPDTVRSFEGIDIAWVEEAHRISKNSWEILIPTLRKEGSEIWVSFNPELETDETYKRLVIDPPSTAIVKKVNWSDNPFFPEVLRQEMEELKRKDKDAWLNVWEGHCRQTLEGAVYANELRDATQAGRICRVPYDPTKPVHTFWDIGWSDSTAIWFAQAIGFDYRVLRYYEANHRTINHFLREMQGFKYVYGNDYLPHDAASTNIAAGGRTIEGLLRAAGRKVIVLDRTSIAVGINAARTIFPNCYFDETNCADGLQCLRRYRYEWDEDNRTFSRTPVHDEWSHGADAFRSLAMSLQEKKKPKLNLDLGRTKMLNLPLESGGWMG